MCSSSRDCDFVHTGFFLKNLGQKDATVCLRANKPFFKNQPEPPAHPCLHVSACAWRLCSLPAPWERRRGLGWKCPKGWRGGSSAHRQHPTAKAAWLSLFIPLLFRNYGVPWQPPDTLWPPDAGPRMGAGALGRAGGSETPSCLVFPWVEDGVKDHQRGCAGPRQRVLRSTVISAAPSAQSLLRAQ